MPFVHVNSISKTHTLLLSFSDLCGLFLKLSSGSGVGASCLLKAFEDKRVQRTWIKKKRLAAFLLSFPTPLTSTTMDGWTDGWLFLIPGRKLSTCFSASATWLLIDSICLFVSSICNDISSRFANVLAFPTPY